MNPVGAIMRSVSYNRCMGTQWTCPVCGRRFRHANTNHSCGRFSLEQHFVGKELIARVLYDQLWKTMQEFGPVTAHPVKTRIVFQAEVQFAAAVIHKDWLEGYIWLRRQAVHPRIQHIEMGIFRDYGHIFRLSQTEDLDEGLVNLLREAYAIGTVVD